MKDDEMVHMVEMRNGSAYGILVVKPEGVHLEDPDLGGIILLK
jgi:hypothetical protein